MCSMKKPSLLRSTEQLASFSWASLGAEVQQTAPTLYAFLDHVLQLHTAPSREKRKKTMKYRRVKKEGIMGLCTAILCRYRNHSMNLIQRLISIILYRGGASKQVQSMF